MAEERFLPEVSVYRPGQALEGGGTKVFHGDDGLGSVYLGPYSCCTADMWSHLQDKDVAGIVNCTRDYDCVHAGVVEYMRVPVNDRPYENILPYLGSAAEFIDRHVRAGKAVLVHCEMGRSRSSTVVIAYLIRFRGMSRNDAYIHMKMLRFSVSPNQGFWEQLGQFETILRQVNDESTTEVFDEDWAMRSCARFSVCGETLVAKTTRHSELVESALISALNHMFSRGVRAEDPRWLAELCACLSSTDAVAIVHRVLQRDSSFMENWGSEVSPGTVQRLLDGLTKE